MPERVKTPWLFHLDHQKAVTPGHDSRSGYEIWYHVDTDAMMQEGYFAENKDVKPILTTIQLREYKNGEYKDVYTYTLPTSISSRSTDGKINISKNVLDSIKPNNKYILVTHSEFRGNFGSAPIIIPDIPQLSNGGITAEVAAHGEDSENDESVHWDYGVAPMKFTSVRRMDLSAIGYTGLPSNDDWYIGLWRQINTSTPQQAAPFDLRTDALAAEELLHHTTGVQSDSFAETVCGDCAPASREMKANDDGTLEYTDVADIPFGSAYSTNYCTRLYVKVPSSYLPHQDAWMIAETEEGTQQAVVSGVEDVNLNLDEFETSSEVRWYDLQGRPVSNPQPGQLLIRVSPQGSHLTVVPR